jgi:hypothetical protein
MIPCSRSQSAIYLCPYRKAQVCISLVTEPSLGRQVMAIESLQVTTYAQITSVVTIVARILFATTVRSLYEERAVLNSYLARVSRHASSLLT